MMLNTNEVQTTLKDIVAALSKQSPQRKGYNFVTSFLCKDEGLMYVSFSGNFVGSHLLNIGE